MLGIFKRKAKKLSTRLQPDEEKQFFSLVKSRRQPVAEVLREAVLFYLKYHDRISQLEQAAAAPETKKEKSGKSNLLPLDYDDLSDTPRKSRLFWGS